MTWKPQGKGFWLEHKQVRREERARERGGGAVNSIREQ